MKINEIIRRQRRELGLTQERMADMLGVSAPAVNKWENGVSYPDITLLAPLARLLEIDLNTLFSFKKELSQAEIAEILNETAVLISAGQPETALRQAQSRVCEYPGCIPLIYGLACILKGLQGMTETLMKQEIEDQLHDWLQLCASAEDPEIRESAVTLLFTEALEQKDLETARALLDQLPKTPAADKTQLEINLHLASGETQEALRLMEKKLSQTAGELSMQLASLMELTAQEGQTELSRKYARLSKHIAEEMGLHPYHLAYPDFMTAFRRRDADGCLKALGLILDSLSSFWDYSSSPLYPHLKGETDMGTFKGVQRTLLIKSICEDKEMAFLRENPLFTQLIEKYPMKKDESEAAVKN